MAIAMISKLVIPFEWPDLNNERSQNRAMQQTQGQICYIIDNCPYWCAYIRQVHLFSLDESANELADPCCRFSYMLAILYDVVRLACYYSAVGI